MTFDISVSYFNYYNPDSSTLKQRCDCFSYLMKKLFSDTNFKCSNETCKSSCYSSLTNCNRGHCNRQYRVDAIDICTMQRNNTVLVEYGLSCDTLFQHRPVVCEALNGISLRYIEYIFASLDTSTSTATGNDQDPIVVGVIVPLNIIIVLGVVAGFCLYRKYKKSAKSFCFL